MTGPTTSAPIKNGVVRRLRTSTLGPLLTGIHQRAARRKTRYPFLTYREVSAPYADDWGSSSDGGIRTIFWLGDLTVWATNPVQAENLLQLANEAFSGRYADRELQPFVEGQTVTRCVTTAELPDTGPVRDEEGRSVWGRGITVAIETVQSIPLGTPPAP